MQSLSLFLSAALTTGAVFAGPENVKFPSDYLKGVRYQTLDRPDSKQYRGSIPAEVVEAVRKGRPIPHGAVTTLVQWSVHQDDPGVPLEDTNGRFIRKDIVGHTVMEKRAGWGAEYGPEMRNGEWEYAAFTADGRPNAKANANIKACSTCHLPHAQQDYVISLAKLNNTFPSAQMAARAGKRVKAM